MKVRDMRRLSKTYGSDLFAMWLLNKDLDDKNRIFNTENIFSEGWELYSKSKNKFYPITDFECPECNEFELRLDYKQTEKGGIGKCSIVCPPCSPSKQELKRMVPSQLKEGLEFGLIGNDQKGFIADFYTLSADNHDYFTRNFFFGMLSTSNALPLEYLSKKKVMNKIDLGTITKMEWDYAYRLNPKTKAAKTALGKYNNKNIGKELMDFFGERKHMVLELSEVMEISGETKFQPRNVDEETVNEFYYLVRHLPKKGLEEIIEQDKEFMKNS